MAEPYSTRELYIEWLTSQNDISLDDDRMYATMTSLNKPAFEMVALYYIQVLIYIKFSTIFMIIVILQMKMSKK